MIGLFETELDKDDIYSEETTGLWLEDDKISSAEEAFMLGYLKA